MLNESQNDSLDRQSGWQLEWGKNANHKTYYLNDINISWFMHMRLQGKGKSD